MINKVGISEKFKVNSKYNGRGFFELRTLVHNDVKCIMKITSVMCSPTQISLEKTGDGVLVSSDFKIKIIYSIKDSEGLYVLESSTSSLVEIETSNKINGESIKGMIKSNSLNGRIFIYDISCCILDGGGILLRVSYYASLSFPKRVNLCFSISQSNISSNLYLTDSKFSNTSQITYEMGPTFPFFLWGWDLDTLFYVKCGVKDNRICEYNKKTQIHRTLTSDFSSISKILLGDLELFVLGIYENIHGLYTLSMNGEISLLHRDENLLSFTIVREDIFNGISNNADLNCPSDNLNGFDDNIIGSGGLSRFNGGLNIYLIAKSSETSEGDDFSVTISKLDFSLFGEEQSISLIGNNFGFSSCGTLGYFIKNGLLTLIELSSLRVISPEVLTGFTDVKFISKIHSGEVLICGKGGLFLFSITSQRIKKLTRKELDILSVSLRDEGCTCLVSLRVLGEITVVSIDLKNNFKNEVLFSIKGESLLL